MLFQRNILYPKERIEDTIKEICKVTVYLFIEEPSFLFMNLDREAFNKYLYMKNYDVNISGRLQLMNLFIIRNT